MSEFENVTVVKEANIYFDGGVSSRTVEFQDGSRKTLGIMLPGEYVFNTEEREHMEIMSGKLEVQLPEGGWQHMRGGQTFDVPENSTFQLKVIEITDYCCSFIK